MCIINVWHSLRYVSVDVFKVNADHSFEILIKMNDQLFGM